MAQTSKKDVLKDDVFHKEAYLVGLAWANPELYSFYPTDKIGSKHFGNSIWKFFFGLGRHMHDDQVNVFDEITVSSTVQELKQQGNFEKFGGYETIEEIMNEVKGNEDNFESYYEEVKKYQMLRELRDLLGTKVLKKNGKYEYKKMSRQQIQMYWQDKMNTIALENGEVKNEEFDLLDDLEEFIAEMDESPDIGMDYYKSKKFTDLTNGWAYGTVSILSAFSGNGKSSFILEKLLMSCIHESEKLLIIANEMDVKQYRKLLFVTIMGAELYEKFEDHFKNASFNRKNLNKGNFTPEEKSKLMMAVKWVKDKTKGDKGLIKFVAMEEYTMDNVEQVIRHYARRGYRRLLVDTAKPSEGNGDKARWEVFVNDFDRLYKLSRKNGGGLDLATFATVQSADTALNMRFLTEQCIADGKKIKNTSDVALHMRPVWADEMEGGNNELKVVQWLPPAKDDMNDEPKPRKVKKRLKPNKVYYLLFCSKNRRGQSNITGADPIVYEVNFNANRWKEVGYAKNVKKDDF